METHLKAFIVEARKANLFITEICFYNYKFNCSVLYLSLISFH